MPVRGEIFQTTREAVEWEWYPPADFLPGGNGVLIIEDVTDPDNVTDVTGTYTTTTTVVWNGTDKFYLLPAITSLVKGRYKLWVQYPNNARSLIKILVVKE